VQHPSTDLRRIPRRARGCYARKHQPSACYHENGHCGISRGSAGDRQRNLKPLIMGLVAEARAERREGRVAVGHLSLVSASAPKGRRRLTAFLATAKIIICRTLATYKGQASRAPPVS